MNTSTANYQKRTNLANRRYDRAKNSTYIGEKLTASVNVEGFGTMNRTYTCVATYPHFARFSYKTRNGVELYECFDYTDVSYIREFKRISSRWVRDYDAA